MKYDEFKEMCHKAWSERLNYLCIVLMGLKILKKANIVFSMKPKIHTLNVFPKVNLFKKLNVVSN